MVAEEVTEVAVEEAPTPVWYDLDKAVPQSA